MISTVILVTGHPATGKTTLSHKLAAALQLPLIGKDIIKECLADAMPRPPSVTNPTEWSRLLSRGTWKLLYQQTEHLMKASVSHIVEANFDPIYADAHWNLLKQQYTFKLIQIRCECEATTILKRYQERIQNGGRHQIHVNAAPDPNFHQSIQSHLGWVDMVGPRFSFNSAKNVDQSEAVLIKALQNELIGNGT